MSLKGEISRLERYLGWRYQFGSHQHIDEVFKAMSVGEFTKGGSVGGK